MISSRCRAKSFEVVSGTKSQIVCTHTHTRCAGPTVPLCLLLMYGVTAGAAPASPSFITTPAHRPRQSHLRSLRHWQRRLGKTLVQKYVGLETRGAIFRELGAVNRALEPNVCGGSGRWMTPCHESIDAGSEKCSGTGRRSGCDLRPVHHQLRLWHRLPTKGGGRRRLSSAPLVSI